MQILSFQCDSDESLQMNSCASFILKPMGSKLVFAGAMFPEFKLVIF